MESGGEGGELEGKRRRRADGGRMEKKEEWMMEGKRRM